MTNNITSVKINVSAKHSLTQMLKMYQAAYDMQFVNNFYVRVIEYILRVFKWAVTSNDAAYAIFITFPEAPENVFRIVNSMAQRFSDEAKDF